MPTSPATHFSGRIERILDERFTVPGALVDLGCGAGRHSLHFASRGFQVTAVDLSHSMLHVVGLKASELGVEPLRVQAESLPARVPSGPEPSTMPCRCSARWA